MLGAQGTAGSAEDIVNAHVCTHSVRGQMATPCEVPPGITESGGWGEPMAITKACAQRIMRKTSALGGSLLSLQQRVILAQRTLLQSSRPVLGQGNGRKCCTGIDGFMDKEQSRDRREEEHLQHHMGDGVHA